MAGPRTIRREWMLNLVMDEVRLRCRYRRRGKKLLDYTVQLELFHRDEWRAVFRYDNAHGFSHYDVIHPDGTQDKVAVYRGDANENFTWAIKELRASWQLQKDRYLAEAEP
jgi:hypothetical protein